MRQRRIWQRFYIYERSNNIQNTRWKVAERKLVSVTFGTRLGCKPFSYKEKIQRGHHSHSHIHYIISLKRRHWFIILYNTIIYIYII
ncbi:hypothetical protein VNO77_43588 [Canavalia gladiata]|uniref:Uncharacterized protein n=1 Tax=Canavalia gladiata TaxID=3824 RepID=A0AAN9JY15_CANGL